MNLPSSERRKSVKQRKKKFGFMVCIVERQPCLMMHQSADLNTDGKHPVRSQCLMSASRMKSLSMAE